VVPLVAVWSAGQERRALREGIELDASASRVAREVGVVRPEAVRVLRVEMIPFPCTTLLSRIWRLTGISPANTVGLCLRHGIFLRSDVWLDRSILAHECVHTAQYERLGGHGAFLRQYLRECLTLGYHHSPLEREAIEKSRPF